MGASWNVNSALGSIWSNNTSSGTANWINQAQQQAIQQYYWQSAHPDITADNITADRLVRYEDKLAYKFKNFVDQLRHEVDNWLKLEVV